MINDCAGVGLSLRVLPVPLSIVTFRQSPGKDCQGDYRVKLAALKRQVENSVVIALLANSRSQNMVVFPRAFFEGDASAGLSHGEFDRCFVAGMTSGWAN